MVIFDSFRGRDRHTARTSTSLSPPGMAFGRRTPRNVSHAPLHLRAISTTFSCRCRAAGRRRPRVWHSAPHMRPRGQPSTLSGIVRRARTTAHCEFGTHRAICESNPGRFRPIYDSGTDRSRIPPSLRPRRPRPLDGEHAGAFRTGACICGRFRRLRLFAIARRDTLEHLAAAVYKTRPAPSPSSGTMQRTRTTAQVHARRCSTSPARTATSADPNQGEFRPLARIESCVPPSACVLGTCPSDRRRAEPFPTSHSISRRIRRPRRVVLARQDGLRPGARLSRRPTTTSVACPPRTLGTGADGAGDTAVARKTARPASCAQKNE